MKKLNSKLLTLTLLLIGVVLMSFTLVNGKKTKEVNEVKTEVKSTTAWRYTGTASDQFNDVSHWELGNGAGCAPTGAMPCQLNIDATDIDELEERFNELSSDEVYNLSSKKN